MAHKDLTRRTQRIELPGRQRIFAKTITPWAVASAAPWWVQGVRSATVVSSGGGGYGDGIAAEFACGGR